MQSIERSVTPKVTTPERVKSMVCELYGALLGARAGRPPCAVCYWERGRAARLVWCFGGSATGVHDGWRTDPRGRDGSGRAARAPSPTMHRPWREKSAAGVSTGTAAGTVVARSATGVRGAQFTDSGYNPIPDSPRCEKYIMRPDIRLL